MAGAGVGRQGLRVIRSSASTSRFRCDSPALAQDDFSFKAAKSAFIRAKKHLKAYTARLRKVARHIDSLAHHFDAATAQGQALLQAALLRYRDDLRPWAEQTAETMVSELAAADEQSWRKISAEIGRGVEKAIVSAPIAPVIAEMKREQVELIQSIPEAAAERVGHLVTEGISKGTRAEAVAAEIMKSGQVSRSKADLIARTETSRVATTLTRARAEHIGSTHFRWLTAGDGDVRPSHRKLNGQTFRWNEPPECDPGHHALPGCIWNCRCVAVPLIPD